MEERIFRLTPLTPVHIGTGEVMGPEQYFIEETTRRLVRYDWHRIVSGWPEQTRRRFEQLILNAVQPEQLKQAREMLQQTARNQPGCHIYSAAIGAESLAELRNADPARRRGEVHLLCRNPHTAEAVIPGSSIKGAIRTAIVNAGIAYADPSVKQEIRRRLESDRHRSTAWELLEAIALEYDRKNTEEDPLRMLRVSDAALPPAAVRVDRVVVRNREGSESSQRKIQLHVERLLSRADGVGPPPSAVIRIALASEWAAHPGSNLKRPLSWEFLEQACNDFYSNRYQEEIRAFSFLAHPGWVPDRLPEGALLLRIGRFSHFESLSVDELRSGWNAQRKKPIQGMGSSRSVCALDGGALAPFGWVLLEPSVV